VIDAEELGTILQDFAGGFAERAREQSSPLKRPQVIEG
jgi:hypothetical protein